VASPYRAMPRLSPSASRIASPSTMPTSSAVWCTSISVSRWSRNGTEVRTLETPVPSRSMDSSTDDSDVDREREAVRLIGHPPA
jgi:hypothetical protein